MIDFYKYQGAGNDFVMIDAYNRQFEGDKKALATKLCDRHFGIGSDGLIFIERTEEADFLMDFYNPDGSQSFCGNGSRCAVAFARERGVFTGDKVNFKAIDGVHQASINDDLVKVSMNDVNTVTKYDDDLFINTGSPHYLLEVDDIDAVDLLTEGSAIRYSQQFAPGGTNVNFIQKISEKHIAIRTYERGVEAETLACGTGATAAALGFAFKHNSQAKMIEVRAKGGDLKVYFNRLNNVFTHVFLEGPATEVFKGFIGE